MRERFTAIAATVCIAFLYTACGSDPELTLFKEEMETFCTDISDIDATINQVDAQSDNAPQELLGYLDELEERFQEFADLDFPKQFDYLESVADEAGEYMTQAVTSYHEAYSDGGYNENTAEYAQENYSRAYKRVQIILSFLHGEEPEDVNLSDTSETASDSATQAIQ